MWILLCIWCLFMHYMSNLHDICFTFPKDIFFKIFNAICRLWHHRASTNYHWNFRFNQTVTRHCRYRHWTEVRERFRFPLKTCTDTGIIEHYLEGFTERRVVLAPELIWLPQHRHVIFQECHQPQGSQGASSTVCFIFFLYQFISLFTICGYAIICGLHLTVMIGRNLGSSRSTKTMLSGPKLSIRRKKRCV